MTLPLVCGAWGDTKCWPERRKRRDTNPDIGIGKKKKVKQFRYTPWRCLGGEEV
jgi:hypothetical protein